MKFRPGDEQDRELCAVLVHEMKLCRRAFAHCEHNLGRMIMGARTPSLPMDCRDAYADFLRHLYEFYVGAFKRDRGTTADIDANTLDRLFNSEVERLLECKRDAIQKERAPEWENHISVYQVHPPSEFGTQFRRIRNANSHADPRRVNPRTDWPVDRFYRECHLYAFLLFQAAQWMWSGKGSQGTLGGIEKFDLGAMRRSS